MLLLGVLSFSACSSNQKSIAADPIGNQTKLLA